MTFAELVALMVLGTGEPDSAAGVVRHSSPEDEDWTQRVWRRGDLVRRESLEGRVLVVEGVDVQWLRFGNHEHFTAIPRQGSMFASPIGGLEPGGERPSFSRWDGTDFTRPTGPVTSTTFLGRDCWLVELAPPRHKPYPIQVTVDAATGLVLRSANREFGSVTEFTEVEIGGELPDDLFVWDGPARPESEYRAERDADHESDMAARRAWLDAHGIVLELPVAPDVVLNEWSGETGAFLASFDVRADGALARQPLGSDAAELNYPHVYRWTDSRWSWALATSRPIAAEQLALVKVQLGKST